MKVDVGGCRERHEKVVKPYAETYQVYVGVEKQVVVLFQFFAHVPKVHIVGVVGLVLVENVVVRKRHMQFRIEANKRDVESVVARIERRVYVVFLRYVGGTEQNRAVLCRNAYCQSNTGHCGDYYFFHFSYGC